MAQFDNILDKWLNYPTGTTITDSNTITIFLTEAANWDGDNFETINQFELVLQVHTKLKKSEIEKITRNMRTKIAVGSNPKNHFEFVKSFCTKYNVKYTLDKRLIIGNIDATDQSVFNEIFLLTAELKSYFGKDYISAAWQKWKSEQLKSAISDFYNRIAYCPSGGAAGWEALAEILCCDLDNHPPQISHQEYRRLLLAVMQGAIWRIKAKLLNKQTSQHIMPYLRGKQGCGKSTLMRWFLKPVEDGYLQTDFGVFEHDEKQIMLKDTPIIFFDEVARADKADAAKVKNMMTAETTMFRKLYGEATKGRIVSTFFGAGNCDLSEVFNDPTGLRRFFQIECPRSMYLQLDQLKADVDPLALWQSVDEHATCPTENPEIIELLIRAQQGRQMLPPVEEWVKSVIHAGGLGYTATQDLFEKFRKWRSDFAENDRTNYSSFCTQLARILRDGDYPHDKRLASDSRRSMYKLGTPAITDGSVIAFPDQNDAGSAEAVRMRNLLKQHQR